VKKEEIIENLLSNLSLPKGKSNDEIWEGMQSRMQETPVISISKRKSLTKRLLPFVAAASVAVAVFFLFPSEQTVAFTNDSDAIMVKSLPDGSEVTISPETTLFYELSESGREVQLSGEAFFDVVKSGNTFSVFTDKGSIEVLGTSFTVTNRVDLLDVKCFTGKVRVETEGAQVNLTKGLGTSSNLQGKTYQHNSESKIQPEGGLKFDNLALNLVLEDLKLYRGIDIDNTSGKNPIISLEFKNEDTSTIVEVISKISGLNSKMVGDSSYKLY